MNHIDPLKEISEEFIKHEPSNNEYQNPIYKIHSVRRYYEVFKEDVVSDTSTPYEFQLWVKSRGEQVSYFNLSHIFKIIRFMLIENQIWDSGDHLKKPVDQWKNETNSDKDILATNDKFSYRNLYKLIKVVHSDIEANHSLNASLSYRTIFSVLKLQKITVNRDTFKKAFEALESKITLLNQLRCKDFAYDSGYQKLLVEIDLPTQLILQGPPGTGKSHQLDARLEEYGIDQDSDRFERVVGHPELTSADFIGQYRPMTRGADKELEYGFVPGPFIRLLKQALDDPKQAYILIIEELNRTNAAAMFAEVFQLLDRRADGQSQYKVNLGLDVNRYLLKKTAKEKDEAFELRAEKHKVRLPANFAIWATMNTADQGVFPMDTAFKRRWSFEYLGVDDREKVWGEPDDNGNHPWDPPITDDMTWQMLRKGINQVLSDHGKDEDRQLGAFFLAQRELGWDPIKKRLVDNHLKTIKDNIMTKVIGYLRDDVLRYEPHILFEENDKQNVKGFSGLISQMKAEGILSVFRTKDINTWKTEFNQYIAKYQVANQKDKLTQTKSRDDSSSEAMNHESEKLNTHQADQTKQEPEFSKNNEDSSQSDES